MAKPDQAYYAYYRRQHRVLGAFLSMHCWHGGYDAVIVDRATLAHIHELTRFSEEHLSWLQTDICPYFPHSSKLYYSKQRKKFAAVVLSRVEIPSGFGAVAMKDEPRVKQWRPKGFRVCVLAELETCESKFTEKSAVTFLTQTAVGLSIPVPQTPVLPVRRRTPIKLPRKIA